jgi:ABC-2 type transport system ATP-binding protein
MAAIVCRGLSKTYGQVEALRTLDLEVAEGVIFGFLGRNGAGKTTTIRLLTGLARPTTGSAWVAGIETTAQDDSGRTSFGYLPEEPAFYGWMTPVEFLDYVARLYDLDAGQRKERVAELLQLVDLTTVAKRRIGGFSRGMRQRLGLAQALIHRPPVLFLDEPASALDPAGRRDVLELIASLRGQTTVFLSSHILADVERVCDSVGIIQDGRLVLVAGREELLARYAANVVVIELEPAADPPLDFIAELARQPWVSQATSEENAIRLVVGDPAAARPAILPLIVAAGLSPLHFEWVRPTLEEVFLALSGDDTRS